MSNSAPVIVWFRQDLRLADNPALDAAVRQGRPILPVYILDDENAEEWAMGAASRWWLHQSLESLNASLEGRLLFVRGDAKAVLPELVQDVAAAGVFWNRCYEPWRIARDTTIKDSLQGDGVSVKSFTGSVLFEPPNTNKPDGTPYRVFTPFYRKGCLENGIPPRQPLPAPHDFPIYDTDAGLSLEELELLPTINWYSEMAELWKPGEAGALKRLKTFLSDGIDHYDEGRNRPDRQYVSRLSPHLHFGEISPNQAWFAVHERNSTRELTPDEDRFLSELGWREFSYNLLYNEPTITSGNLQRKFDRFPWIDDDASLKRWQQGKTGYPIVDAGMRELWRTGYMHNRVRMIVGSFLVKNLLQHWRHGARWFWDTLVDADLANNSASWQWIAGCGADAAPYFRIFNPVTQGKKFDPEGNYVRQYVPELASLPEKFIHNPWEAPEEVLTKVGVTIGRDYPAPVVDLKPSRERALAAFKSLSLSSS
ncbi:MAG: DNA photolyase family protein [Gammaproteobacteria bacterium]|nr:DNA photolyase family protein [Gammaproteobacteria bacterium]MDH3363292.1 DNA photolyase family protein [Gammaproteobacteria bacterium]MDH3480097.1 DNA photolyase family protein [Gammaproteobacteria bacterium]